MAWSMYKNSEGPFETWEPNYVAWYVNKDMDTNHYPNRIKFLHDGPVEVHFDNNSVTCTVIDGKWAPDTERKICDMVAKTYWGIYIEGFAMIEGKLNVLMGS